MRLRSLGLSKLLWEDEIMNYEEAKAWCHVRSSIYREANGIKYPKNHTIPLDDRISEEDKQATDWEEWDPRDDDGCSLFMFND
jgi:hypothetical protein